jgi:hypothetical protein
VNSSKVKNPKKRLSPSAHDFNPKRCHGCHGNVGGMHIWLAEGRGEIGELNSFPEEGSVDRRKAAPEPPGEYKNGIHGFRLTVSLCHGKLAVYSLEEF